MSLTAETIREIAAFVEREGLSEDIVSQLRRQYQCHFTWCFEDDMTSGRPWLETKGFNIYLVDSREHCSELTTEPEIASGLVLAEVIE